jgi:hypothetical protein
MIPRYSCNSLENSKPIPDFSGSVKPESLQNEAAGLY